MADRWYCVKVNDELLPWTAGRRPEDARDAATKRWCRSWKACEALGLRIVPIDVEETDDAEAD